jgi:adenine-specific DNA-methyltransferase
MPRSKNPSPTVAAPSAFTHDSSTRTGLPAGGTAGKAPVPKAPKKKYWYNPHLSPVLRHDSTGQADRILALVQKAGREPLSQDEQKLLQEALRTHQPWLEWSGKREAEEKGYFEVDPVALSIHERVSPQAILRAAKREDIQRDLFADPQESWTEAVKFYRHDVEWANRMILGDSLQVMTSLAERENLAGKVQMIYIDPPYGIKFRSNFQPIVGKTNVDDDASSLTREPEQVRAFRDTWSLGLHSYLDYLNQRLKVAWHLLSEHGSCFVQISEDNVHSVRSLLDGIFGAAQFCGQVVFRKTTGKASELLDPTYDILLWYARNKDRVKYRQIQNERTIDDDYNLRWVHMANGAYWRAASLNEMKDVLSREGMAFRPNPLTSQTPSATTTFPIDYEGRSFLPGNRGWSTNAVGISRLIDSNRLIPQGNTLGFVRYLDDFPYKPINNIWDDTRQSGYGDEKVYVVQTSSKAIERCLLMTTDPGDLVLDPTCGSGTTAYVAEQWGRRWITIDTSRVALAIARQRLMTARFENYRVRKPSGGTAENPGTGFIYKTVPHITLKSIAQNRNLDPIFDKHEPLLDAALMACNKALATVDKGLKARLQARLAAKQSAEGKRAISDADKRRWKLKEAWEHWEVPFDTDPDWPVALQTAVTEYRKRWQAKMDEVNACIAANADQEELVDQPQGTTGVRVSGPFTVEGVLPVEYTREAAHAAPELAADSGNAAGLMLTIDPAPAYGSSNDTTESELDEDAGRNAEAYYDNMLRLLRLDGVTFKGNVVKKFAKLEALWSEGRDLPWQAEGWWEGEDQSLPASVAVIFGPQYGPLTAMVLEEALQAAPRSGYTELVCAAFSFEPELTEIVADEASHTRLRIHQAFIRPDVNPGMEGLLKDQAKSQLFTVFGKPEIRLDHQKDGSWTVTLEGVDIYDPLTGDVHSTGAGKVAAWFLDSDYDGRAFCITQAFFPDQDAWEKIRKALKTEAEDYAFDAYKGTVSVPFKTGKFGRIAVKVIDPRGNEVMVVKKLEGR